MQHDVWLLTRSLLQKTLNPSQFSLWIAPLSAQADDHDDSLTLTAPNPFVADWVRDRLADSIREAAAQVLGSAPRIVITATKSETGVKRQSMQLLGLPLSQGGSAAAGTAGSAGSVASAGYNAQCGRPAVSGTPVAPTATWRYSFRDFVVGPSNNLAFAAAQSLSRAGLSSEQLFLCSAAGLGKTHLIQAVGQSAFAESNRQNVRVRYLTAEEFATRMILALRSGDIANFKTSFREGVDLLLMEDVHFLQGKTKIQDELLSTLKALRERGCRAVFSSSFLPRELTEMDDHLRSRLSSGVIAYIDKPDFDTRCRILQEKALRLQFAVPKDVNALLAETIDGDIRQLESCLQNLVLKAKLLNQSLTVDMAREVLAHYATDKGQSVMERIVGAVCKVYGLSNDELASKSRKRHIVQARNTAFFMARRHTQMSLKDIGQRFGRRHSTVIKGITSLEKEMSKRTPEGRQLKQTIDRILI